MKNAPCPCQSKKPFAECCGLYINAKQRAPNAESLMRSRYTAYTLSDWKYIYKTWHRDSRPSMKSLRSGETVEWLGLKLVNTEAGATGDYMGIVEFVATYKGQQGVAQLKERSHFIFQDQQWFYHHGE